VEAVKWNCIFSRRSKGTEVADIFVVERSGKFWRRSSIDRGEDAERRQSRRIHEFPVRDVNMWHQV
jgi:hypothetical protein